MASKRKIIITAIAVTSVDGRFTKGAERNIYHWSSREDFSHFRNEVEKNNLLVMGSGTFEPVKGIQEAGLKPEKERLRVIMTKNPKKYTEFFVPGQMEFTDEEPKALLARLEKLGYTRMLFVGGGRLLATFLEEQLIDELLLTIEPRIFGTGGILETSHDMDIQLELLETKQLNKQGTLLLRYNVIK